MIIKVKKKKLYQNGYRIKKKKKTMLFDLSDPLEVVPNVLRNSTTTNLTRQCS